MSGSGVKTVRIAGKNKGRIYVFQFGRSCGEIKFMPAAFLPPWRALRAGHNHVSPSSSLVKTQGGWKSCRELISRGRRKSREVFSPPPLFLLAEKIF